MKSAKVSANCCNGVTGSKDFLWWHHFFGTIYFSINPHQSTSCQFLSSHGLMVVQLSAMHNMAVVISPALRPLRKLANAAVRIAAESSVSWYVHWSVIVVFFFQIVWQHAGWYWDFLKDPHVLFVWKLWTVIFERRWSIFLFTKYTNFSFVWICVWDT